MPAAVKCPGEEFIPPSSQSFSSREGSCFHRRLEERQPYARVLNSEVWGWGSQCPGSHPLSCHTILARGEVPSGDRVCELQSQAPSTLLPTCLPIRWLFLTNRSHRPSLPQLWVVPTWFYPVGHTVAEKFLHLPRSPPRIATSFPPSREGAAPRAQRPGAPSLGLEGQPSSTRSGRPGSQPPVYTAHVASRGRLLTVN